MRTGGFPFSGPDSSGRSGFRHNYVPDALNTAFLGPGILEDAVKNDVKTTEKIGLWACGDTSEVSPKLLRNFTADRQNR